MALTIGFRFPWGRFHATPWGRHVNEGVPEWPPSPWRICRALYATWKNRVPDLDEALVSGVLGKLAGPPSFRLPPHGEFHTRHYYPDSGHKKGLSGSTDMVMDPFVVLPPDAETLVRWDTDLSATEGKCLAELLERLTYLGRSESICSARVVDDVHELDDRWITPLDHPVNARTLRVLVPSTPLDLDDLTQRPDSLRRKGYIEPKGATRVEYVRPEPRRHSFAPAAPALPEGTVVRFALGGSARPSRKAAVALGHVLRQAAMSVFGGSDRAQSATLSGRSHESDPLQSQHAHAHYLAFSSRSDSRLDTALVWAPNGFSIEELNSLSGLKQLRPHDAISDLRPCRVGLEGFGRVEDIAPEVVGPSRTWRSFTPFAPTRHKQANESLADFLTAEVARELRYRRIQAPAKVEMVKGDWLSFRRHRPSGRDTLSTARRAYGLRLDFAEPISGPIVIGGLSHFGLGLFVPEQ